MVGGDPDHRCLLCVGCRKHGSSVRFWCLSSAGRTGGAGPATENVWMKGRSWCSVRCKVKPEPSLSIKQGCYRAWKGAGRMLRHQQGTHRWLLMEKELLPVWAHPSLGRWSSSPGELRALGEVAASRGADCLPSRTAEGSAEALQDFGKLREVTELFLPAEQDLP